MARLRSAGINPNGSDTPGPPRVDGEIIVAGDAHLGAANADVAAFEAFLADVGHRHPARVVLLGDIWDLLRRDPFGVAWEHSGTISRIRTLAERLPVHLVLGNHDGLLGHLDTARYDVHFCDSLTLESGDVRVHFTHGQEFDRLHSETISTLLAGPGDRGDIDPTRGAKDPVVAWGRGAIAASKRQLRTLIGDGGTEAIDFPRRERRAHAHLERLPADKLVYGHTHAPYVHPANTAANPGSWKSTAPVHNTYLVVDEGHLALYRYRQDGPDVPIEPSGV